MRKFRIGLTAVFFCLAALCSAKDDFTFSCSPKNDLFLALSKNVKRSSRCDSPLEAVTRAKDNSAVLILAENYPTETTRIEPAVYEIAAKKNLRLYVEFPSAVPGIEFGPVKKTVWERGVVASGDFGSVLPKMRILAVHDCHFLPTAFEKPLLVIARVAGYDTAVFGLPTNAAPLLFELPEKKIIVATTKLSNFRTARYAPSGDWETIWGFILDRLSPQSAPPKIVNAPSVAPAFSANEKMHSHFEKKAFDAAADWFGKSQLLVAPSDQAEITEALKKNQETRPLPKNVKSSLADGSLGILEGYASGIQHDGSQLQRLPLRADCNAESAMLLALDSFLNQDKQSAAISKNLLDFVYFNSGICQGPRADPKHGAYGLIGWGDISPTWLIASYGDDEARTMQATMLASAALKSDKWNDVLARALLANFRTTGKFGFRGDRIDLPSFAQHGWKYFRDAETVNYAPHFETGLWACYLWAYQQTKFRPFLDKTKTGIAMTMKVYPDGWRFRDQMERARMLLTLAWLVRAEDTGEHRAWLDLIATDLLKRQSPSGAIYEWLGGTGGGHYQVPQSNEAYGTGETPLIQQNGDPATDQLYSTGFALLGLHEAVAATGDAKLKKAEDKLAEFLCRIQVRSKQFPFVDGWWFRAFDDRRWEYWASSADAGWGAWSLEAGWGQAWTATTLGLREMKSSLWDFTANEKFAASFNKWKEPMLEKP